MNVEHKAISRAAKTEVTETSWGHLTWLVSRQVGNSTRMSFARVTIKAGHENARHRHPNCDEILYVLAGQVEHSLAGQILVLGPGDTVVIPEGIWHQTRAVGTQDCEFIICFSSADRLTEVAL